MFLSREFYYTRIKAQLANIITLMNLSFGIIAIIFILEGLGHISLVFILLAAIFDRYDGMVARHFNTESAFGKELDSLCDLVSFGIAPALLIYVTVFSEMLWIGVLVTVFYILAGAIRLARYNVSEFNGVFCGVPITVAGVILALSYFIDPYMKDGFYVILMLILTYLMVSSMRITKI